MDTHSRAALDLVQTADRVNSQTESSLTADAWQREYFSVLPELDELARYFADLLIFLAALSPSTLRAVNLNALMLQYVQLLQKEERHEGCRYHACKPA